MDSVNYNFELLKSTPSDINEHLETLKKYSEECETIVEMGVRWIVSTWAFLAANPKKLTSLDLYHPSIFGGDLQSVIEAAKLRSINYEFVESDSLLYDLTDCDLLFIDTIHNYSQLRKELFRHHSKVKKYIIFHDTNTFGFKDEYYDESEVETNLPKGLVPAIDEFLFKNPQWTLFERKPNNNGLTVIKRLY